MDVYQFKYFSYRFVLVLLLLGVSSCGRIKEELKKVNEPEVLASPSPTPTPTPTPAFLKFLREPSYEASAGGTLHLSPSEWLDKKWLSSSDSNLSIGDHDMKHFSSFIDVRDKKDSLISIKHAAVRSDVEPGLRLTFLMWVRNAAGERARTSVSIKIVEPFLETSEKSIELDSEGGKLEIDMVALQQEGIIQASTETVFIDNFESDAPLYDCELSSDDRKVQNLLRCSYRAEATESKYDLKIPIGTGDGLTTTLVYKLKYKK